MSFYCSARRTGVAALVLAFLATGAVFGQGTAVEATTLAPDGTPALIRLLSPGPSATAARPTGDSRQVLRQYLHLGGGDDMRPLRTETDALGYVHERFQQYYRGLKVEHGHYTVHRRGGLVETLSGEIKRPSAVNVRPSLTAAQARQQALAAVGARRYMWQDTDEEQALRQLSGDATATYFPQGELVLVNDFRQAAAPLVLAWKFNIYAVEPLSRAWVYVEAHSGQVVFTDNIIKHTAPVGNFATKYSANQIGTTDSTGSGYRLRDESRGLGIQTFNLQKRTKYSTGVDFIDADNNWTAAEYDNVNFDNAALDAHYGAQATYDYWQTVHGRNSFDDAGSPIFSYVHYKTGYDNAFWNGMVVTYGDGVRRFLPLTSVDICAHEIGHAVCQYTAGLIYQNESGALNEGLSDIWGACVEYFKDPTKQTWLIGEEITKTAIALRSMSNPKQFSQPDTYQGTRWIASTTTPSASNDYGGVHINSGVLNYWFYLLSVGGAGTNDAGKAYSVSGITIAKAAAITYRAERLYLTSTANFVAMRHATLQAAYDLYGAGSAEVTAVAHAWYAVGLGEAVPTLTALSLTSGPVGASVTLTSTNLLTTTAVRFNGVAATSYTVNSATSLTVLVPVGATSGLVTVNTPSGMATSASGFAVTSVGVAPALTAFTPAAGQAIGGSVVLTGANLTGATSVTFNGKAAGFVVQSSTSISATVPVGAMSGVLQVTTPGGIATAAMSFQVLPGLTGVAPVAGVAGTPVTLTGTSFTSAREVAFNGVITTDFTVVNDSLLTTRVPARATTGAIVVRTASGEGTSASVFTVIASLPPVITAFLPISGGPNQPVVITGRGFYGAAGVAFGGVAAGTFTVTSDSTLAAIVPLNAVSGSISISTPGGSDTSVGVFSVGAPVCALAVTITPALPVACDANSNTVVLTATAQGAAQVPTYTVAPIPFASLSIIGKGGPTGDDGVTAELPIGFTFSFFGRAYTSFYVSTNGNIQFTGTPSNSAYYGGTIPTAGDSLNNFIALAWANWNRAYGGTITYYTTGTAPNRKLVVSFSNVPYFYGGATLTAQAVLYEGSNLIDIIYTNVGALAPWALAGLENATGTVGVVLPGRNNTYWRASNEAWRFTPASTPGPVAFTWDGPAGIVSTQGTAATVQVSGPTFYTVTATDSECSRTDTVFVDTQVPPPVAPGATRCGPGPLTLTASGAPAGGSYQWYADSQTPITGATGAEVTTPVITSSTTYYVAAVSSSGCESAVRIPVPVTIWPLPATPIVTASPAVILLNQSTTLAVSNIEAGVSYSWNGPGLVATTGASVLALPLTTGEAIYTVTATSANGCASVVTGSATLLVKPGAVPTISTFTPTSGPVGTSVTISGSNFSAASAVLFNGVPAASFIVNSNTSLTAVVPATGSTGKISITTIAGTGLAVATFKVRPTITGFSASGGMPGDVVTIMGTGFLGTTSVKFGTVATTQVTVLDGLVLRAVVPPLATTGKLYVTSPGGMGLSETSFTVGPIVTGFLPAQGAPGTVVLVQGLNFVNGTTVKINDIPATTTYNSSRQLTAVVPITTTGLVRATSAIGTTTGAANYKVVSGAIPTISAFTPTTNVIAGTAITITGTNLTGATLVRFNNADAASFTVNSATSIMATVPTGALTGKIYVVTSTGMAQSSTILTIIAPPTVRSFYPLSGSPGSVVLIAGTNLTGATSVKLNGMAVPYAVNSATQLVATIPAGATSDKFVVTTIAGAATSASAFTVTSTPAPTISSLSADAGVPGGTLVVTGTNFSREVMVQLGAVTVTSYTVNSTTKLTLTVPPTAVTGRVYVAAAGGMAQSPAHFTVIQPPTISSFSPTTAAVGTLVTINGTNFTGATSVGFGAGSSATFTLVSPTRITVNVPAGASTGELRVTNPAGTATAASTFTVPGARAAAVDAKPSEPMRVELYPNPASGQVRVQVVGLSADQAPPPVELFDFANRCIRTLTLPETTGVLLLDALPPGIYTLRAGAAVQRLIVQ